MTASYRASGRIATWAALGAAYGSAVAVADDDAEGFVLVVVSCAVQAVSPSVRSSAAASVVLVARTVRVRVMRGFLRWNRDGGTTDGRAPVC